jgi:hypothetical protein
MSFSWSSGYHPWRARVLPPPSTGYFGALGQQIKQWQEHRKRSFIMTLVLIADNTPLLRRPLLWAICRAHFKFRKLPGQLWPGWLQYLSSGCMR